MHMKISAVAIATIILVFATAIFLSIDTYVQSVDVTVYDPVTQQILATLQIFFTSIPVTIAVVLGRNTFGYLFRYSKTNAEYEWRYLAENWLTFEQVILPLIVILDAVGLQLPIAKAISAGAVFIVSILASVIFNRFVPQTT